MIDRHLRRLLLGSVLLLAANASTSGAWAQSADAAAAACTPPQTVDDLELRLATIRSKAEFDAYIRANTTADMPFNLLSVDAQRRFTASLKFDRFPRGAFPDLADLEAELTLSQAWRLLSLFGLQRLVVFMPDIRIVSDDDKAIAAWRVVFNKATS